MYLHKKEKSFPIDEINTRFSSVLVCASFPQSELQGWMEVNTVEACFCSFLSLSKILESGRKGQKRLLLETAGGLVSWIFSVKKQFRGNRLMFYN